MHYHESRVLMSTDGMQVKTYANEHPQGKIIVKPKYIPTSKIKCDEFQQRVMFGGVPVNRLNVWVNQDKLAKYIQEFRQAYPDYIFDSEVHDTWFFCIPENKIAEAPDPRKGVSDLMKKDYEKLDDYSKLMYDLMLLLEKQVPLKDVGITNSSLLGNYTYGRSDIDAMIYGKKNYVGVIEYLKTIKDNKHLRPKTTQEWIDYYNTYNQGLNFSQDEFIWHAARKNSDMFFGPGTVLSVFGVEEPNEVAIKWGDEKYVRKGFVTITGKVTNADNGVVRPGFYEITDSRIIEGNHDVPVKRVMTFARDFMLQAKVGETLQACGVLEEVIPWNKSFKPFYQVTVGYFDSYIDRRGKEYIKVKR